MADDEELFGKGYIIVVAIDFGTTYSGYAYCQHSDYRKNKADPIIHCNRWSTGTSFTSKAPTCVLFNEKKEFVKFGYEAMSYYHENPEKKDFSDWYYFENFKMILYEEKDKLTKNTDLQDSVGIDDGKRKKKKDKIKAVDVFAAVIKYFKEQLFDTREKAGKSNNDRIRWVITVPAIWDLKAKTFMRDAAVKAGIPTKQLLLALEPEAASIHCRRVPVGIQSEGDGRRVIAGLNIGSKYIVLDQGGGTTDIAVHEVSGENTLKEIHQACGGHWGGTTVNAQFTKFLNDLFGADVIEQVKKKSSSAYFKLLRNFENAKTEFTYDDEKEAEDFKTILLPVEWIEVFEEKNKKTLVDTIKKTNFNNRVQVKGGKLRLRHSLFRTFFEYAIENITKELNKLLCMEELSDVSNLLIVGGHSESTVLTTAIKKAFPKLGTVVPKQPSLAILKGAVLFGFEPEIITSRVMQYTYGISMLRPFKAGVDDESVKTRLVHGLVDNVFDKHLTRGQTVKVGEFQPEHEYVPVHKDQKGVHYEFYATTNKNPKYVTDEGCKCIGILYFELSEGMSNDKKMMLKINASGTEIDAIVTEKATGKQSDGLSKPNAGIKFPQYQNVLCCVTIRSMPLLMDCKSPMVFTRQLASFFEDGNI